MLFTKDMATAKTNTFIWEGKILGKQSDWRRYRVVEVRTGHCYDNPTFEYYIEETDIMSYTSFLPKFLGGYWGFYYKVYWQKCDIESYKTHKEATDKCNQMLATALNYEKELERPVTKEIISWHPDEVISGGEV